MIRKASSFALALGVSFVLIAAIPILHIIYRGGLNRDRLQAIGPRQVEVYRKPKKKEKRAKVIKQIKQRKLTRSNKPKRSRFQIDLSVSGPANGAVIEKNDLKVESYELGQTDTPPVLKRQIRPTMPIRAQEEEVEGKVFVRFLVDEQGRVMYPRIVKEEPMGYGFGAKALEAVGRYQFDPATLRGIPVKIWVTQEIEFLLDQ